MKECIEEWWRIGRRNYNHKWGIPKSLQASPLDSQEIPMFFKLFKPLKSALEVCQIEFSNLPPNALSFPFYMLRILAKTRSSDVLSPVARQLACHWRDSRDYMPLACQLALWLASGSPVGAPLACSFSKIENWLFLAPFSSFVVALGFHRASNTCPPLPTQARKRVEEFLCLTYTIIKLQISHKWMISYLHHFLLVFMCFVVYVSSKIVWTRRK